MGPAPSTAPWQCFHLHFQFEFLIVAQLWLFSFWVCRALDKYCKWPGPGTGAGTGTGTGTVTGTGLGPPMMTEV